MINQVLVAPNGLVYVATPCGLAASKDSGKSFSFIRGADWAAKVKGLYGGAPKGWKPQSGAFTLLEDYCSCLALDESGYLWVGHWRKGYEVIDPTTLERLYPSGPGVGATGKRSLPVKGGEAQRPDYVFTILPLPGKPPLIGWYGQGISESDFVPPKPKHRGAPGAGATGKRSLPVSGEGAASSPLHGTFGNGDSFTPVADIPRLPSPAGPPTLEELNALLSRLGTVPALKTLSPTVVELADDWRTGGDWLGRYGRYWACLCAIDSPQDYIWGAGTEPIDYHAYIGPNHPQKDDSLRYWVHWLYTDNPRSLEMPPTYLDSRIQKGLTTPDKNRRQAEWDDHSEAYSPTLDGPHVYCTLRIPAGQFYLSLYDFNKDDHEGDNCLRDYRISIRPHNPALASGFAAEFDRQPETARGRIHDFWCGCWKRYYVQGPVALSIQVNKNGSKNTILAGVMLDLLDERPPPYFCSLAAWQQQMAGLGRARTALFGESAPARADHCKPRGDLLSAGEALFDELERLRLQNTPWWAAENRYFYLALSRLYSAPGLFPDDALARRLLAASHYQLRMFRQWEELLRAGRLTPARDVEKALRWDGFTARNSGFGYRRVLYYLGELKGAGGAD